MSEIEKEHERRTGEKERERESMRGRERATRAR